jgi:hypothetical protein
VASISPRGVAGLMCDRIARVGVQTICHRRAAGELRDLVLRVEARGLAGDNPTGHFFGLKGTEHSCVDSHSVQTPCLPCVVPFLTSRCRGRRVAAKARTDHHTVASSGQAGLGTEHAASLPLVPMLPCTRLTVSRSDEGC